MYKRQLVNSLTDQIDGEIDFDRSNGTKFTITFKELVLSLIHIYKNKILIVKACNLKIHKYLVNNYIQQIGILILNYRNFSISNYPL